MHRLGKKQTRKSLRNIYPALNERTTKRESRSWCGKEVLLLNLKNLVIMRAKSRVLLPFIYISKSYGNQR